MESRKPMGRVYPENRSKMQKPLGVKGLTGSQGWQQGDISEASDGMNEEYESDATDPEELIFAAKLTLHRLQKK